MSTNEDSSAAGSKPITPFIHTRPAESKIQATLLGPNSTFPFVEKIIKEYIRQRPTHIQEACFEHNKKCFEDRVIPFLDIFKIHVTHYEVTWFNDPIEFNRIFDELDNTFAKCFMDNQSLYATNKQNIAKNKSLQIQKKNLLIHGESLIADCIAKDVCSIVLASEREVLLRSNCRCEELQSTYDREHSRVCKQPNATASNAIFEITKLKAQLQEKDDTIRHLHAEKDILGLLNVGSTESSFKTKALETEIAQLKEEKIATQKAAIATLKAEAVGKKNSGPTGTLTKSKVLALGMYAISSKYIPPQKRADWVQLTLLPKKKQVTYLEPHRTSPRSTQKPPFQHKKPTVLVNMFPKAKPTTEARKPIPKRNTQIYNPLLAKSVKARRAANYYRNLSVDISQFVDRSTKSVHTKPHKAKRVMNTSTNAWNATMNTVTRILPIWKPTARRFNLHDIFG
uniref:Uncharacterized protein n=1 Tax=Tanacetum cinerariifolium TaxID=118510 RepID=A0A699JTQ6_TANCI|nr:hypothetical protein [Tanacetum cinerariifolium]